MQEIVRTLWSTDRKSRVIVFRRTDGTFGFLEERYSDDELEKCWIPYFGETESFCATEDIAMREATSRIAWLAEMLATFEDVDGLPRQHPDPPPLHGSTVPASFKSISSVADIDILAIVLIEATDSCKAQQFALQSVSTTGMTGTICFRVMRNGLSCLTQPFVARRGHATGRV